MRTTRFGYLTSFLIPCLFFSTAAGVITGILIFLFKLSASLVIRLSEHFYTAVRTDPGRLPLLLLGVVLIGLAASLVLARVPDCRGGGIPTSIALLRGLVTFRWLRSIVFVFLSAMLTYLGGVPLGNEGPSVQMGTAVGRGIVRKYPAWNRYIMTGGACAGFAAATGAPVTGMFFAFEEAHRRFSPLIFLAASLSAISGSVTMNVLCSFCDMEYTLFRAAETAVLPIRYYWVAAVSGILVGLSAAVFTKAYRRIRRFIRKTLKNIPGFVKITVVFVSAALIGFFSEDCIGSGHHLVSELLSGHGIWYRLTVIFIIRAVLLLTATNADITGGLFVPTLAFGAILGALCGEILVRAGLLPPAYYILTVIMGIVSFLGASSRTPLMALTFAVEVLGGLANLLPIGICVTLAYLTIETLGIPSFTDTVVESKAEAAHTGKTCRIMDFSMTAAPGSFAVGKEIRDIFWPPAAMILSVKKAESGHTHGGTGIEAGDVLQIHLSTFDPEETLRELTALVGEQEPGFASGDHKAEA